MHIGEYLVKINMFQYEIVFTSIKCGRSYQIALSEHSINACPIAFDTISASNDKILVKINID